MPFTNPGPPPSSGGDGQQFTPLAQPSASPFSVGGQPLQQGQLYEPGDLFNEDSESSAAQDIDEVLGEEETQKKPLNTKIIIAIACAVVLLIIFIIVIVGAVKSSSNNVKDDYQYEDTSPAVAYEPAAGTVWWEEDVASSEAVTEPLPQKWALPSEDSEALRAAGYTSTEIEDIESREITDIKPFLTKAAEDKKKFLLEQYHFLQERMAAGIDEETSYIFNNSIFSLPAQELGEVELDTWEQEVPAVRETKRENVNYTKLPLLGNQCLLKLELHDGTIAYFYVQPERYEALDKESGNIVIKYTEVLWRDCRFIVNIEELPI